MYSKKAPMLVCLFIRIKNVLYNTCIATLTDLNFIH